MTNNEIVTRLKTLDEGIVNFKKRVDALEKGGPGSGPHKFAVGDKVKRNPKIFKTTPKLVEHHHGTIVAVHDGHDNQGKAMKGYLVRSLHDESILKDPNADKWDKKSAERGTFFGEKELLPR